MQQDGEHMVIESGEQIALLSLHYTEMRCFMSSVPMVGCGGVI